MVPKALLPRVIAGILLACFLLFGCAGCRRQVPTPGAAEGKAEDKVGTPETAAATNNPKDDRTTGDGEEKGIDYARGYVRVISPTASGWLPLPEEEDYVYPLRQVGGDGREIVNVIHVTPSGVYMESANCENQDCVLQGEVTLDNKESRPLENMIICLPHQVVLELYSTEELLALSAEQEGAPGDQPTAK